MSLNEALFLQMETAAIKAASETRNKVFQRKVTAVYTPSTLEAGTFDDVGAEADADGIESIAESSYLFCLSEREAAGEARGTSLESCCPL
jgi:hypothetical protein